MRLLGATFPLHDVRNVEAHVRALLDATLRHWSAHLDSDEYDDALAFLIEKCWELSGLDGHGRPRLVWVVKGVHLGADGTYKLFTLGPVSSEQHADELLAAQRGRPGFVTGALEQTRPPGAYDPAFGISFSTYSRRTLPQRLVDHYRKNFADIRYHAAPAEQEHCNRCGLPRGDWDERRCVAGTALSLESLADELDRPVVELLDDQEWIQEEVLVRAAVGR